jgi:thioredoxin reductase/ferredoxin
MTVVDYQKPSTDWPLWKKALRPVTSYTRWLHTRWPAGKPEKLPVADEQGRTAVDGLSIVGDLTGIPLLKLSANAGVDAVRRVADELGDSRAEADVLDVAIIGGGASGISAALEAEKLGLRYCVFEAARPFNTIKDFPKGKHIYLYPTDRPIEADFTLTDKSDVKEGLIEELETQTVDRGLKLVSGRVSHIERKGGLLHVVCPDGVESADKASLNGTGFVVGEKRVKAKKVIVGIGRSGNYRRLGVPGEELSDKVSSRLHDPAEYGGKHVLIVGGGDSALESAIALVKTGADVTLSYRKPEFNRPKPENAETINRLADNPDAEAEVETASDHRQGVSHGEWMKDDQPDGTAFAKGRLTLLMNSDVTEIREDAVDVKLKDSGETKTVENDQVFTMIGREAPLEFFRKSAVPIRGERSTWWWVSLIGFLIFCTWLYHWKADKPFFGIGGGYGETRWGLYTPSWLNLDPAVIWAGILGITPQPVINYFSADTTLGGVMVNALGSRSFYYTFAYSACVVIFGIDRMMRRKTPYVKVQTLTLMAFQVFPLFLLPELILPYMGANGWFDGGPMGWLADQFFPNGEYWRAYGLILAWPLMAWNLFTSEPIWGWVVLGVFQTFVFIPAIVYFLGKGAYCGWICSCGALAETLGDRHREKMPHGPFWNRFNMVGQVLLLFAFVLQGMYILRWMDVQWAVGATDFLAMNAPFISWAWFVDLLWAGIIGVGLYFWFSGRVWCRFACPLAALMHIYHRFGQFAILADKKKCISCNVCTSVCHQGIDVMSFANKGKPMKDPECVRCSACVQMCPTGVLSFGRISRGGVVLGEDKLAASPVRMKEVQLTVNGKNL